MTIRMPWAGGPDPEDSLALRPFDPAFRGTWEWVQPVRFRSRWRLTCDGEPVATFAARSLFGAPTTARFAGGTWELRHRFPAWTVVTRSGEAEPWGRFRPGWFGSGTVTRTRENPLLWRPDGFWMHSWTFATPDQIPLVHFRRTRGVLRHGAIVELEDAARRMADLPAVLALGWLLVLRIARQHAR